MTMRHVEPTLELWHSYRAAIRALEEDAAKIDLALRVLRERLREHEREHGFNVGAHGEKEPT